MTEPNGPSVYVPPSQRDEMLALINVNRRAAGLLPQQYPGHDPYAEDVTTEEVDLGIGPDGDGAS